MDKKQEKRLEGLIHSKREKQDLSPMSAKEIAEHTGIDLEEVEGLQSSAMLKLCEAIKKAYGVELTPTEAKESPFPSMVAHEKYTGRKVNDAEWALLQIIHKDFFDKLEAKKKIEINKNNRLKDNF